VSGSDREASQSHLMMNMKMIGAAKARMNVPSQCRMKTIVNVFSQSVHVCRRKPISANTSLQTRRKDEGVMKAATRILMSREARPGVAGRPRV